VGSAPAIIGATIVAIAWRWHRRDRDGAAILAGLAVVTQLLDVVRLRGSFPSGHAMNAVATYGLISILIARERPRIRFLFFGMAVLISLAIGVARVYLRLHWPTDVLGGYCTGLLLLSITVFWLERLSGKTPSQQ
jgi:membrane-associated phospholipid phosphatase